MKRYKLLTRAFIDGGLREPGYVFTLPDDVRPPHRNRHAGHQDIHGAIGTPTEMHDGVLPDEPLVEFLEHIPDGAPAVASEGAAGDPNAPPAPAPNTPPEAT